MNAPAIIGSANAVLVLGGDKANSRAVVTVVDAKPVRYQPKSRIAVVGPVSLDETAMTQLNTVVVSSIDQILRGVGRPLANYKISFGNIGLASSADVGLKVRGFSADMSVFVAALSASLQIPVGRDTLFTGHMAASNGEVAPVSGIAAKVEAAIADDEVEVLFVPKAGSGESTMRLPETAMREWSVAILRAKSVLRVEEVSTVLDVVSRGFADSAIVMGSLRRGYFEPAGTAFQAPGTASGIVAYLTQNNPRRFWRVLESFLLCGNQEAGRSLLEAYIEYWDERDLYPEGLGRSLQELVISLPPSTRRAFKGTPLCGTPACVSLAKLAGARDLDDLKLVLDVRKGRTNIGKMPATLAPESESTTEATTGTLDFVLAQIEPDALEREIGVSIDDARAAYSLPASTVEEYEQFLEAISSFYVHLLRHSGRVVADNPERDPGPDALALLNRAYSQNGGFQTAWFNTKHGEQGGLRSVLDAMTDRYKWEEMEKRVNLVLKEAFDPLEYAERLSLVAHLIQRVSPNLPEEAIEQPPERYAARIEEIARAYVRSMHSVTRLVRSM